MATPPPPQIPSTFDVIGPMVDRLVEVRPTAAPHVVAGRYGDLIAGQTGQFRVLRGRLVQEALAARLPFAAGEALTDLAASEYETERAVGALRAVGEATLTRSVVHYRATDVQALDAATDGDTVDYLLVHIWAQLSAHALDVFSAPTGLGAHVLAAPEPDSVPALDPVTTPMSSWVAYVNYFRNFLNEHFAGETWHKDADVDNVIDVDDAFANDAGAAFDDNSNAARQSVIAVANACLRAYNAHVALDSAAGSIRRGLTWALKPDPAAAPAVTGGQYEATVDVPINVGVQTVVVPVRATRTGAANNIPAWSTGGPTLVISTPVLFDAGASLPLVTTLLAAAGGSDGQSDAELRRAAATAARGGAGPTSLALDAGALATTGASRTVTRDDTDTGTAYVYPVDVSWAQSAAWVAGVVSALADDWQGFGCRVASGSVVNRIVRLELTVVLRATAYLADTSEITDAVQTALRAYFDDRPDWYVWRTVALRAVVSRAHKRVLTCSAASMRDESGEPLTEPAQPTGGAVLTHYTFADNAVSISYVGPV